MRNDDEMIPWLSGYVINLLIIIYNCILSTIDRLLLPLDSLTETIIKETDNDNNYKDCMNNYLSNTVLLQYV